jgi:hypothetical protein
MIMVFTPWRFSMMNPDNWTQEMRDDAEATRAAVLKFMEDDYNVMMFGDPNSPQPVGILNVTFTEEHEAFRFVDPLNGKPKNHYERMMQRRRK